MHSSLVGQSTSACTLSDLRLILLMIGNQMHLFSSFRFVLFRLVTGGKNVGYGFFRMEVGFSKPISVMAVRISADPSL
jgi:hypothetical protein